MIDFETEVEAALEKLLQDPDCTVREILASGYPVYYKQEGDITNNGILVKEYPDGRKELIEVDPDSDEYIERVIKQL